MNISEALSNATMLERCKYPINTDILKKSQLSCEDCKKISEAVWPNLVYVILSNRSKR
jgi:hypothetical protein